jgi:hypothetical protein
MIFKPSGMIFKASGMTFKASGIAFKASEITFRPSEIGLSCYHLRGGTPMFSTPGDGERGLEQRI